MTLRRLKSQAPLREAPDVAVCPRCDGQRCIKDARGLFIPCPHCAGIGETSPQQLDTAANNSGKDKAKTTTSDRLAADSPRKQTAASGCGE